MEPARGDSRPCTCAGCTGTMQFGRESDNRDTDNDAAGARPAPFSFTAPDAKGWICSKDPRHFRRAA